VPERDTELLQKIQTLQTINLQPAAEFWKAQMVLPFQELKPEWVSRVQGMELAQQVQAVVAELKRRNPGFDGQVGWVPVDDRVFRFEVNCDKVQDLTPIQALTKLRELQCSGSTAGSGILENLNPVAKMASLEHLICLSNHITDLAPLRGLRLTHLDISFNPVSDLSVIRELPLESLMMHAVPATEFSPLKGLSLKVLGMDYVQMKDLTPLSGMPLKYLSCVDAPVTQLDGLTNVPLEFLNCSGVPFQTLAPLKTTALRELLFDFREDRDAETLRSITTLATINGKPVADFWASLKPQ
jgi:hypothetical protein